MYVDVILTFLLEGSVVHLYQEMTTTSVLEPITDVFNTNFNK